MKDKDISIKKKQAADAIAQANIDREMMSKRDDRPLPKVIPKPVPKVVPMPTDVNRDEMRNADLQREMRLIDLLVAALVGGIVGILIVEIKSWKE